MARAGMLQRAGKNGAESTGCTDEVARSLELLDRVLSEFEEPAPPTPPPLQPADHGHQSEDDGYMSMNGRRAKFALGFRPMVEQDEMQINSSPPPPEEAERIISNLIVSPPHGSKRISPKKMKAPPPPPPTEDELCSLISINGISSTKQTTFPKTRHQRPYGWDKDSNENENEEEYIAEPQNPSCRFSSLQANKQRIHTPPNWLPAHHLRRLDRATTEKLLSKKSPSLDNPPSLAFMGFSNEFVSKPYNEHPVTIYPGPNTQFNKHGQSPFNIPKFNNKIELELDNSKKIFKKDSRADIELVSANNKIPPRTLAGSMERHRDVRRSSTEDVYHKDEEHFSDDSLEEGLPTPPQNITSPSKRNSIAWEVSLDDDPLLTPGSTKVIGRRRRKSGDNNWNETGRNGEYWPPPPLNCSTEEELTSPFSDTDSEYQRLSADMKNCGTYVIRRGKNRKEIPAFSKSLQKDSKAIHSENKAQKPDRSKSQDILNSSPKVKLPKTYYASSSLSPREHPRLNTPKSRHSIDLNVSRVSQELNTPKSRYSIDLCSSSPRLFKEMNTPKSRLSLDLNKPCDSLRIMERFESSPKNTKKPPKLDGNNIRQQKDYHSKLSPQNRFTDFKKYSSTFDNIKSLIKEGVVEDCPCPEKEEETVTEIKTTTPVRVVSLPSLAVEETATRPALITTVEEEEDPEREDSSPLRKIENNISAILNRDRRAPYSPKDWNIHKDEYEDEMSDEHVIEGEVLYASRERNSKRDVQKSASHGEIPTQRSIERRERSFGRKGSGVQKSTSTKDVQSSLNRQPSSSDSAVSSVGDFPINVHVVEHSFMPHNASPGLDLGPLPQTPESPSFPPLPPSPVPEVDDEYSEILQTSEQLKCRKQMHATPELRHRVIETPSGPLHRESNSLKTRSMETSYNKNKRNSHFKSGSTDRRTLPTEMAAVIGGSNKRRTFGRGARTLQTSASLPETPIFTRGIDIARTPMRTQLPPRTSTTLSSIQTGGGSSTISGYGRGSGYEHALTGAELLRMAGGPGRGWYPRQKNRSTASIEHLDRLGGTGKSVSDHHVAWDGTGSRKPLTLPPNITPKFFQRSPREALRRVTSLLIRKGNTKEKECRNKETTSPATRSANGDELPGQKQKKGFFRSLWKRSRHYSLEHP